MKNSEPCVLTSSSDVDSMIGSVLGVAHHEPFTQEIVNAFAEVTGDNQWIHVDTEAAKAGPFGSTIVHGFFTLALIPVLGGKVYRYENTVARINYGLNRVRFPNTLPIGDGVSSQVSLVSADNKTGGQLLEFEHDIRRTSDNKTVCVARSLTLIIWKKA